MFFLPPGLPLLFRNAVRTIVALPHPSPDRPADAHTQPDTETDDEQGEEDLENPALLPAQPPVGRARPAAPHRAGQVLPLLAALLAVLAEARGGPHGACFLDGGGRVVAAVAVCGGIRIGVSIAEVGGEWRDGFGGGGGSCLREVDVGGGGGRGGETGDVDAGFGFALLEGGAGGWVRVEGRERVGRGCVVAALFEVVGSDCLRGERDLVERGEGWVGVGSWGGEWVGLWFRECHDVFLGRNEVWLGSFTEKTNWELTK